jgi:hypothetical protein
VPGGERQQIDAFKLDMQDVPSSDKQSKSPSIEEANYKKRLKLFRQKSQLKDVSSGTGINSANSS